MNEEEKRRYLKHYKAKKADGEMFWPDAIAKDAVTSLLIVVLLVGLAVFVGVPKEPPANPGDATYIPRPEWYFMWTFQLLKYFPGSLEGVAITGLGVVIAVGLFGLPFFDRGPKRHPLNRPVASAAMVLIVLAIAFLTIQAVATTPPQAEAVDLGATKEAQAKAGDALFQKNCAECHGAAGEGATLESGEVTAPLNSDDFLKPHLDDTIFEIVSYGQPGEGMQAFGLANGGQLTDQEIRAVVTFIRSWAAEEETTAGGAQADLSALAKIENPSFAQDVKSILDKKCLSCHGKRVKNNFSVETYDKLMTSGDHAPNVAAGDASTSQLTQMLRAIKTPAGGLMPPTRALPKEQIELIERWINQGAQNN